MLTLQITIALLASDFPVCNHPAFQNYPNVIFSDSMYYVFYSDLRYPDACIFASRVTPNGVILDSVGRLIYQSNTSFGARAASDGQNLLAVFRDGC
ncbi:hypothetical protein AMJ83_06060 [candidate division WOR_3 bacterium SM23_42]|uniref:SMP-30/Gluconolactonase/LRE-like region domain-containing protein n=1 Tax=candidate division WOR_3 bacterium SM23_42 TaxID=1703779 RepID=A0A0S8FST2_UNCW3|nr:MAG: hypothetical protein AMJ83_06060 [candidate division WOR_3 bacterium SM23_42]